MEMMTRTLKSIAAAAVLLLVASTAQAGAVISLIWRINGTDTIDPMVDMVGGLPFLGGTGYVLDVVLSTDVDVTGVFISFNFDTDGENELNFISAGPIELGTAKVGMGNSYAPLSQGFASVVESGGSGGALEGFDQATLNTGLSSGSLTLGSMVFSANTGTADTDDIIGVILSNGIDAMLGAAGANINGSTTFLGATVTGVPEPTTALLVVLGLAGLGLAGRRSIG
jgi:hypothetical protein